jgi:HD-like signal output (HDOD) protein
MLSLIEPTLFERLRSERALPSPSGVRLTIMQMCAQDDPDMSELVRLVQADPALSGRVIRIVNMFNAHRLRPIASISIDVLLLIGLQSIRQFSLALSLADSQRPPPDVKFDFSGFWTRAFAMAASAQAIAGHTKVAPLAELFTAGLLASIGKLTLALNQSVSYSALLSRHLDTKAQLAMEQSLFGYNHLNLATALMQDWKMPLLFCDAVLYHELPMTSGLPTGSRGQEVVWTLNLAAAIAEISCASTPPTPQTMSRVKVALEHLHLAWDDFAEIYAVAGLEWEDWIKTMGISSSVIWRELPDETLLTPPQ